MKKTGQIDSNFLRKLATECDSLFRLGFGKNKDLETKAKQEGPVTETDLAVSKRITDNLFVHNFSAENILQEAIE